jgi:hypothetical protein
MGKCVKCGLGVDGRKKQLIPKEKDGEYVLLLQDICDDCYELISVTEAI